MPFRPDRRRRDDRFLEWKIRLFTIAAVAAMAGIYLDERWMTGTAIVVLAAGMALRFLPGGGAAPGEPTDPDGSAGTEDTVGGEHAAGQEDDRPLG